MRPPHQALRGWLLAFASTGLAVAAHGVAGGGLPDATLTVPLTALIALGGTALAGRLQSVPAMVAALGTVQLGLHLLLTEMAAPDHLAGRHLNGWLMFAGHAAATLITATLLTRASAVLGLVAWIRARLTGPRYVPARAPAGVPPGSTRPGQLIEVVLRRVSARRGPPLRS